jgi:hypothetical protein
MRLSRLLLCGALLAALSGRAHGEALEVRAIRQVIWCQTEGALFPSAEGRLSWGDWMNDAGLSSSAW